MLGRTSPSEFAALPLDTQLERLRAALSVEDPRQLLLLCAGLRDFAPLGFLCERLFLDGFFRDPASREFFAGFLVAQSEMAVHRVLRALADRLAAARSTEAAARSDAESLCATLLLSLARAPLARLTSMCLIDRALKHHFPLERDRAVDTLCARAAEQIESGQPEALSLDELAQLPGRVVPELRRRAAAHGPETLRRFDARRAELASAAIAVLSEAPKAVSQANAEDLLARRVYTDPGHFLIELLQNAEDAGARTFRISCERSRLCIWHDGHPFDARDLVGVTSIGQTTKRKQQIGFFGVGFKSVYEVTERPQVFSDVYRFEIADVSLPKELGRRPPGLPEDGTLLVLPLRQPDDRARSAAALYQKARALDPCVLLTLRSIRALELELGASAGGPARQVVQRLPALREGHAVLRQEPEGWERAYLLQDDEYRYDQGQREAGRPDATRVLLGVRVDATGVPQPLPEDAPTVYSYLPTSERSGLRFFVQGHFDVPVDRERLTQESPWNRWILSKVPVQLARLLLRAATGEPAQTDAVSADVRRGLLLVLPLGREIGSPLFRGLPALLRLALWETPILPGLDGEPHAPCETLLATPQVAALLGTEPLPRSLLPARKRSPEEIEPGPLAPSLHLIDPELPERSLEVARALGCEPLDAQRLLLLLAQALSPLPSGSLPPPALTQLLGSTGRLVPLYDLFLSELEEQERRGHLGPARELLARLRTLPLLPDEQGRLHRTEMGPQSLARGPDELRAIYRGLRPLLHPELDTLRSESEPEPGPKLQPQPQPQPQPHDEPAPGERVSALLHRLGVSRLSRESLVRELEATAGTLVRGMGLLAPERHERLLALLATATLGLQRRACALPILPGRDGTLRPAARDLGDTAGLCAPATGRYAAALHAFYAGAPTVRPLPPLPPPPAVERLLAEVGAPALSIDILLHDLERDAGRLAAGVTRLRELHRLLEELADELPERGRRLLERLPIWPDRRGIGRPLRGAGAVYLPAGDEILAILPMAPLLDPEVAERRHTRELRPQPLSAWLIELVEQLARPGQPLSTQAAFLSTLPALAAVLRALAGAPPPATGAPPRLPLADVQLRLHLVPPSPPAPATTPAPATPGGGALHDADDETRALAAGLAVEGELVHPALLGALPPGARAALPPLPLHRLLTSLALPAGSSAPPRLPLADAARRAALYRFIASHEHALFSDARCRDALRVTRLWPSRGGQLLSVEELVLDPELPDLGVDWAPHPEVPAALLQLLARHLEAGQRPLPDLVRRHLRPAYVEAVRRRDAGLAGRILGYLAARLADYPAETLRALLCPPGEPSALAIEDEAGTFRLLDEVVVPLPEHAAPLRALFGPRCPLPSPRYPAEVTRLLGRLGTRALPSLEQLKAALRPGALSTPQAQALGALLPALFERHGEALWHDLPLRELPWLLDGTQRPRRPGELYRPDPEVELLIGTAPDLYPSPQILLHLPEPLCDALGLRGPRDIQLPTVLRHLDQCERAQRTVSFRVYLWLERRLQKGQLDESVLRQELSGRRWICLDEGRFVSHTQVLGVVALRYFGSRRSAWERGAEECPSLCRLMGIPRAVTTEAVAGFLGELGREVALRGDRPLLTAEPALPRMLLACYALLGRSNQAIARELPVVLCRVQAPLGPRATIAGQGKPRVEPSEPGDEHDDAHDAERYRLLPARDPSLLRSDTPTLERLFRTAGVLHLCVPGPPEERDDVERFHQALGIRRLREAYTINLDESAGRDRSAACGPQLARLRGVLHALLGVLPRVQAQRTQLPAAGWAFERRLRPLADAGSLVAMESLRVRYRLDGVGEASAEVAAAYDPARGALLLDSDVLDDPLSYASGLAQALLPCIYDGPNEEQLIDIIEILLPLYTAARMNDYLDRRHFPTVGPRRRVLDRIADRLLEILDYGLDARLGRRFPELAGATLRAWRDPGLLAGFAEIVPDGDAPLGEEEATLIARHALLAGGVAAPSGALVDALAGLLRAPSLGELPAGLLGETGSRAAASSSPAEPEPLAPAPDPQSRDAAQREREAADLRRAIDELSAAVSAEAGGPPLAVRPSADDEPLAISPQSAIGAALAGAYDGQGPTVKRQPPAPAPGAAAAPPARPDAEPPGPAIPPTVPAPTAKPTQAPPPHDSPWPALPGEEPAEGGLLSRVARLFGLGRPAPPPLPPPPALSTGNCLEPAEGIEPQLWATPQTLRALAQKPVLAQLRFTPPKLPSPYLYAVRALGGAFVAEAQRWQPAGLGATDWLRGLRPSGHTVIFEGQVAVGLSTLPLPLYGRLRTEPRVLDGPSERLDLLGPQFDGVFCLRVHGDRPLRLRYEVELLEVPALTQQREYLQAPPGLLLPTLPLKQLADEVQAFVQERRRLRAPAWEQAVAVQSFVQWRYAYDLGFRDRPEVKARAARLRPGKGNHHLELLHASADETYLGRGSCFELNMLVVELLRHLAVPAVLAGGWALDLGFLDRPDHLYALAVLYSSSGPCLMPLDATRGPQGPRRLLPGIGEPAPLIGSASGSTTGAGPGQAAAGGSVAMPALGSAPPVPPVPGPWSADEVLPNPGNPSDRAPDGTEHPAQGMAEAMAVLSAAESRHLLRDAELSLRALQLVSRRTGRPLPEEVALLQSQPALPPPERAARLRTALELVLGDSEQAAALLWVLRVGEPQVTALTPALEALAALGVLEVRAVPQFQVQPAPDPAPAPEGK
ncbi:MAG: hypothetical protein U1A78_22290 [Polyangia bacterium]